MNKPRGICTGCDRELALLTSGNVQAHTHPKIKVAGKRQPCPGENKPPKGSSLE